MDTILIFTIFPPWLNKKFRLSFQLSEQQRLFVTGHDCYAPNGISSGDNFMPQIPIN
jgi:hypothetical protein